MRKNYKIGDIILVRHFVDFDNKPMKPHPFVVTDDNQGIIEGMDFNIVSNMLGSYHNEHHREFKRKFDGNVELKICDGVKKNGFVRGEQLYYFYDEDTDFFVIGNVTDDALQRIIDKIIQMNNENKLIYNTNNLFRCSEVSMIIGDEDIEDEELEDDELEL